VAAIIRAARIRRRWRQVDLAQRAAASTSMVSRIERGHLDNMPYAVIRRVAAALDIRLEYIARWHGGELDRLVNARHSALHESVARHFAGLSAWRIVPEVSFSIYGERGVIDVLAWHATTATACVVELKTDIVDVQELLGSLDRKRRLAPTIARERGWLATPGSRDSRPRPITVGTWLIVLDSSVNRRRLAAHLTVLRAALPEDGRSMRRWLRAPAGAIAAASFWPIDRNVHALRSQQRVRAGRTRDHPGRSSAHVGEP
jgi:transcriptional regulator with XRE-family HTH domain